MTAPFIRVGAPEPQGRERPRHRCGQCNNGTGIYNPACPNRPRNVVEYPWEVL